MTLRLLLIEDSESDAALIVRELQRGGYEVIWERVATAAALLAALAQPWDVITCDWAVPQCSALAALGLLRDHHIDAPIIIVSNEVGEEVAVSAMRAGAQDFVSKDRLTRLVPAIERELREAGVRRARKRAEDALKESEQHFRSLIENALDLVSIVDAAGTIRYASPSHEQASGFPPEELVGRNAFDFVHPDDVERVRRRFAEGLARQERTGSTEYRFRRKDGSWGVVEGVARNLMTDPVVRGVLVNSRDITSRKQAEEALRQHAEEVRDLYDHAPCGYHSLDREGTFVRINDTELEWLGYTRDEIVGRRRFSDVITPASQEVFRESFPRSIERGSVKDLELEMVRKDGSTFPVLLNATAVRDASGQFVMSRSTVVDLTERKRTEETVRANERRFRLFLEAAPDAVLVVKQDGHLIDFASAHAEQLFGYRREELLGQPIELLVPERLRGTHVELRDQYSSNPTARPMAPGRELCARRKDGSEFLADIMLGPIELGRDRLVFTVIRDITERRRAEHTIRERTRTLDALFDHSLSCLVLLDRHFNFIRVNAAYARACGRELHEFAGRNHFDLYPSDAQAIFEQVVETKQPFEAIARPFSFPDQPERGMTYWDWTLVPVLDDRGAVDFLLFSLHDVTEHVRTAEALRANEARLQVGLRVADIAAFSQDRELRYTWMQHPQLGYSVDQVIGKTDAELLPPADAGHIMAIKRRVMETNVGAHEEVQVAAAGQVRVYDLALEPLRDATGAVVGLTGASFDITERKRVEERLRAHALRLDALREIYRAILDARSVRDVVGAAVQRIRDLVRCELAIVLLFDTEAGVARVVANEPPDVFGQGAITTLPLGDFSALATFVDHPAIYIEDIATLEPRSPIVQRLCAAGMHSLLTEALIGRGELLGVLNLSAAQPAAFAAEHRDIAREVADQLAIAIYQARLHERLQQHAAELERRVQERTVQFEAANKELASFSYSVSHDLRTPLRAVEGFSRSLLEEYGATLGTGGRHYLDRIVAGAQRMGQLIEDLLRLARVAQYEMVQQVVNLSDLVRVIAADLQRSEPSRRVEFVIAPGVVATGDARLLRIALENLFGNAWKYTSKHPTARIEFGTTERDDLVVYFVRDDGAGFDMAYAQKLFGAFQRLQAEPEFEGTGVGLATVQRIMHRHGGRIWAEGAVDKGATFYFTLGS